MVIMTLIPDIAKSVFAMPCKVAVRPGAVTFEILRWETFSRDSIRLALNLKAVQEGFFSSQREERRGKERTREILPYIPQTESLETLVDSVDDDVDVFGRLMVSVRVVGEASCVRSLVYLSCLEFLCQSLAHTADGVQGCFPLADLGVHHLEKQRIT